MFTTSATVAISETERFVEDAPNTRVMRTVDAVPMADSAMVTILSICKALPTAGGRIGSERSEHELVNVADHDLHK